MAAATRARILALHGYPGTIGCKAGVDPLAALRAGLEAHGVVADIVAPMAPNRTQDGTGVAWIAGDQQQAGKVVGFGRLAELMAERGMDSELPPLDESSLPPLTEEDNIWHGAAGLERSMAKLERMWASERFDGILGFSQGALTAAIFSSYLREQMPRLPQPRFTILCGGFLRPYPLSTERWWPPKPELELSSLHVIGRADTVVAPCRSQELTSAFVGAAVHYHSLIGDPRAYGGHVLPWDDEFYTVAAEFVKRSLREGDSADDRE